MKYFKGKKMLLAALSLSMCLGSSTVLGASNTNDNVNSQQIQAAASMDYAGLNWSWPTDSTTISDGFGNTGSRYHKGVDIAVKLVPVRSAAAAVVIQSGTYNDGTKAMTLRHNTVDTTTNKNLVTRYLHLNDMNYSTGDHIGQYVEIAESGNTGGVGYHLHFDVNKLNETYPDDNETIDPMLFYPSLSFSSFAGFAASEGNHEDHNHKYHSDKEFFFDNNVINFVGKDKFEKWFEETELENRTLTNLKKEFKLSDKKISELTSEKVKATELKMFGVTAE